MTASTHTSNVRQNHWYDDMSFVDIKKILHVSLAPLFPTHITCTLYYTAHNKGGNLRLCKHYFLVMS